MNKVNCKVQEIRVSCVHLAIIDVEGKYAMLKSLGSAIPKYSQVGGHMKCTDEARKFIEREFDARFHDESNDIIFYTDVKQIHDFKKNWFDTGIGRDTVRTELRGELILENKILENLDGIVVEQIDTLEKISKSTRKGQVGQISYYFFDIYRAELTPEQKKRFKEFAATDNTLAFLTKEELTKKTYKGCKLEGDIVALYV